MMRTLQKNSRLGLGFCSLLYLGSCGNSFLHNSAQRDPAAARNEVSDAANDDYVSQKPDNSSGGSSYISLTKEDKACKAVPYSLRQQFYGHYMRSASIKTPTERGVLAAKTAKLLGIAIKESSGNPSCVTDMTGAGSSTSVKTYFSENSRRGVSWAGNMKISLSSRSTLLGLKIRKDKQTNYGILQMSADRLTNKASQDAYAYFRNIVLNNSRHAIEYCGTDLLYIGSKSDLERNLKEAASCSGGYQSAAQIACFAKFVTICPNLNLAIGMNAPSAYFATKSASPRCSAAFTELAARAGSKSR